MHSAHNHLYAVPDLPEGPSPEDFSSDEEYLIHLGSQPSAIERAVMPEQSDAERWQESQRHLMEAAHEAIFSKGNFDSSENRMRSVGLPTEVVAAMSRYVDGDLPTGEVYTYDINTNTYFSISSTNRANAGYFYGINVVSPLKKRIPEPQFERDLNIGLVEENGEIREQPMMYGGIMSAADVEEARRVDGKGPGKAAAFDALTKGIELSVPSDKDAFEKAQKQKRREKNGKAAGRLAALRSIF